jgi:hypothetical protein
MNVFAYAPQRHAVQHFLENLGVPPRGRVRFVDDHHPIAGHNGVHFMIVANHPDPLPRELNAALLAHGVTLVTIDDSPARARWARG